MREPRPTLTITPGLDGFRLAYVGGPTFEVVGNYPTRQAALSAYQQAVLAVERLTAICRSPA